MHIYIYIYIYIYQFESHLMMYCIKQKGFLKNIYFVKYFAFFREASSVFYNLRKHQIQINTAININ